MRAVPAGSLLVVLLQIACGGGSAEIPGDAGQEAAEEAGTSDGEAADASEDAAVDAGQDAGPLPGGVCNDLQPGDTFVQSTDSGTPTAPAPEGGMLVSGLYHLASTTYYPARTCARAPVATTLMVEAASISSGTMKLAAGIASGEAFTESIRYSSAGTLLSTRIDCFNVDPGGVKGSAAIISYSATPTEVRLITNSPGCGFSVDLYQM